MYGNSRYVHADLSGEFSNLGKWSTAALFIVVWGAILATPRLVSGSRTVVALTGSLGMIILRKSLTYFGQGPHFDVSQHVPIEPLVFLFASMLLTATLGPSLKKVKFEHHSKYMAFFTGAAAMWRMDSVFESALEFCEKSSYPPVVFFALTWSATLGSALTVTGSLSSMAVMAFAYDNIAWTEFLQNMILPVVASLVVVHAGVGSFLYFLPKSQDSDTNRIGEAYSRVPSHRKEMEEDSFFEENKCIDEEELALPKRDDSKEHTVSNLSDAVRACVVLVMFTLLALGGDIFTVTLSAGTLLLLLYDGNGIPQSDVSSTVSGRSA
jgi:Na+/H+ antiporter NhaD/arsenite permease-like protein